MKPENYRFRSRRSLSRLASLHNTKSSGGGPEDKLPDPADLRQRWLSLTRRERQVLALVCHPLETRWCEPQQVRCPVQRGPGYLTNRQIAARLFVSPETIKTHLTHGLVKLGLRNKGELRRALAGWNLQAWESPEQEDR